MKNRFFTFILAIYALTLPQTKLVAVDTIPTLNMYYGNIKNVAEDTNKNGEPTRKYVYEPDPAQVGIRSSKTDPDNNVQDAIAKVQSIYSNLSAEEKRKFNKIYKEFLDTCKIIISKHEISFNRSSNPSAHNLGPVEFKK